MSEAHRNLDELKSILGDRLEELAENLLGTPNADTRRHSEWRWGSKGSVALVVRSHGGKERGSFFNHESGQGGGALDLIMFARACDFRGAVDFAKNWVGWDGDTHRPAPQSDEALQERARKNAERRAEAEREAQTKADYAVRLYGQSAPVSGTVAERYLTQTRRIPGLASGWPDCIRFHAGTQSLLVAATTAEGAVRAVQRVFLTDDGRKVSPDDLAARNLRAVKQTNGPGDGVAGRLPGDPDGPLLLAEGPETGLSAWVATGMETWIALGGLRKLQPQPGRRVVVCRDDDKRHSPADKALVRLLADWRADGIDVVVATPWAVRRFDKSDLNDTIRDEGGGATRQRIERAINPAATMIERRPIGEVRRALDGAVAEFFRFAMEWQPPSKKSNEAADGDGAEVDPEPPPVHAIRVDVGAGKSRAAYRYILSTLQKMRAAGDMRKIAVAVPTHKLGDEQVSIFNDISIEANAGLTAKLWRGMNAIDPDHSDADDDAVPAADKTRMCQNPDAVKAARDAGVDVRQAACRKKPKGEEAILCPFFAGCGYQRQRGAQADLWIVPHELLFLEKLAALGDLALLIVDEACWRDGLEGVDGRPTGIELDDLRAADRIEDENGGTVRIDTERLHYLRNRLLDSLADQPDGPLQREAIHGDLNYENAGEAGRLEWRLMVDPDLNPGLSADERKERAKKAAGNPRVMRLAGLWRAVRHLLADGGPAQSGWLSLATEYDQNGKPYRVLHVKGRRDVRAGWQVPTLLLDATMNIDLVRPYWPQVELTAELLAEAPHQHIRQVIDRAFSKSMLEPMTEEDAAANPSEAKRRHRNLRTVHAMVCREARLYHPQRVLVVAQKAIKVALPSFGPLPVNVEVAHHNAVAGRDQWGPQPGGDPGVRAIIVIGRTQATLGAVHRLTEALTGSAVRRLDGGWYGRGDAVRERVGGLVDAVETDRHPDPVAEAIRWQICEGELVQIIGRGRGVNRTVENPLDVLVMTDAVVPMPVEETLSFADLDPSPEDLMMAAAGVVLMNSRHAASVFPQLWPSHDAAKKAFQRRSGTNPYKNSIYIGECPTPLSYSYQVAGPGQKAAQALFDPSTCPDPEAFLAERLGTLSWFKLDSAAPSMPSVGAETQPPSVTNDGTEFLKSDNGDPMPDWLGAPGWDDEASWSGPGLEDAAFFRATSPDRMEQPDFQASGGVDPP